MGRVWSEGKNVGREAIGGRCPILQGLVACRPWKELNFYLFSGKPLQDIEQGSEVLSVTELFWLLWGDCTVAGSPHGGGEVRRQ